MYCTFTNESVGESILKIGQHFVNLQARLYTVSLQLICSFCI